MGKISHVGREKTLKPLERRNLEARYEYKYEEIKAWEAGR